MDSYESHAEYSCIQDGKSSNCASPPTIPGFGESVVRRKREKASCSSSGVRFLRAAAMAKAGGGRGRRASSGPGGETADKGPSSLGSNWDFDAPSTIGDLDRMLEPASPATLAREAAWFGTAQPHLFTRDENDSLGREGRGLTSHSATSSDKENMEMGATLTKGSKHGHGLEKQSSVTGTGVEDVGTGIGSNISRAGSGERPGRMSRIGKRPRLEGAKVDASNSPLKPERVLGASVLAACTKENSMKYKLEEFQQRKKAAKAGAVSSTLASKTVAPSNSVAGCGSSKVVEKSAKTSVSGAPGGRLTGKDGPKPVATLAASRAMPMPPGHSAVRGRPGPGLGPGPLPVTAGGARGSSRPRRDARRCASVPANVRSRNSSTRQALPEPAASELEAKALQTVKRGGGRGRGGVNSKAGGPRPTVGTQKERAAAAAAGVRVQGKGTTGVVIRADAAGGRLRAAAGARARREATKTAARGGASSVGSRRFTVGSSTTDSCRRPAKGVSIAAELGQDSELKARLAAHNKTVRQQLTKGKCKYEPARRVKDYKLWERNTGKVYRSLSTDERIEANREIDHMLGRTTGD